MRLKLTETEIEWMEEKGITFPWKDLQGGGGRRHREKRNGGKGKGGA